MKYTTYELNTPERTLLSTKYYLTNIINHAQKKQLKPDFLRHSSYNRPHNIFVSNRWII